MPRWTNATCCGVKCSAGKAVFASATNAAISDAATDGRADGGTTSDWLVPMSARPYQGTSVSMRPDEDGAASAMSRAGTVVTRFIAFSIGMSRASPNIAITPGACAPAALIVARASIANVRPVIVSRTSIPETRPPVRTADTASR